MIEQVLQYKRGLLSILIYSMVVGWVYFAISPNIWKIQTVMGLVVCFLFFQYVFKSPPEAPQLVNVPVISSWRLFRSFFVPLLVVIASFGVIFYDDSKDGLRSLMSVFPLMIGMAILFIYLFKSIFVYIKTRDKRYLPVILIFGAILLGLSRFL